MNKDIVQLKSRYFILNTTRQQEVLEPIGKHSESTDLVYLNILFSWNILFKDED